MLKRFLPRADPFTLSLLATVVLASVLPARGATAQVFEVATNVAIALLFFLHGAKLPRRAILGAATHWRLHLLVLGFTFVLFPLLGLALKPLVHGLLTPDLYLGVLFLCALPSTVQSSIAFTSIARGNVPAAVVSASLSSLVGIFVTPLLVGLLLAQRGGGASWQGVLDIVLQLLLPFVAGHLLRPWIGGFVDGHRRLVHATDQGTIVLVVYTAFSASVVAGLWRDTPWLALLGVVLLSALLLAIVMPTVAWVARRLGFERGDRIAIFFCGSKKSMASGIPMAKILFAGHVGGIGALVLPLMVFHQLQLMVCAVVAERYAAQVRADGAVETPRRRD